MDSSLILLAVSGCSLEAHIPDRTPRSQLVSAAELRCAYASGDKDLVQLAHQNGSRYVAPRFDVARCQFDARCTCGWFIAFSLL
ncbi:unnamed protein product [Toxocara canis]|uniref:PINc domain-containing protein n=1 Tax=Toxocara canis TaxID=6265 RepID=A0A183V7G3_TOXCA|nr:unnamed protein product [Toxocara canis]